ncbi:MAG: fatty acid desaturase family protein [Bacteroidota bacterium]
MSNLKFTGNNSAFYSELKQRVNKYFEEHGRSVHGGNAALVKAIVLIGGFLFLYALLAFRFLPYPWDLLACIPLAFLTAGIGFNIMHDGAHGSLSSHPFLNRLAALSLNMLGASSFMWNIKHNVIHHTFTNVEDHDDDILNQPFFRMSPSQPHNRMHKWQHIYWPLGYGLMYVAWIFFLDIRKYFNKQIAEKTEIKIPFSVHVGFWVTKILYTLCFVVIPLQFYSVGEFLIGYLTYTFTTGIVISVIFQLAHTVEETTFVMPDSESGTLQNDWASHQVLTTANFATRNKIITWFVGGLNFQVEHHLFPRISHVHYPALSPIVQETCERHGLRYINQPTLWGAINSHVKFLQKLGS